MKKIVAFLLICIFGAAPAHAQHMVKEESYLTDNITYIGLPDYPPFSYYQTKGKTVVYESAFLKPTLDIMNKYGFQIDEKTFTQIPDFQSLILDIRSGDAQLFFGTYSNTKIFNGVSLIYPASISNPIHIITLPDTQKKIKSIENLGKLKGVISKTEYLSDFVLRKIKPLNIKYVDSPNEAYEALFTANADYILGSLYYNRIMASRLGIEQYLAYSKKPVFKIPFFVALTKIMPKQSLYQKAFETEFAKPNYAKAVKEEIIKLVEEELTKNQGIVPPAFTQKTNITTIEQSDNELLENSDKRGKVIEEEIKEKTFDDVLDGI